MDTFLYIGSVVGRILVGTMLVIAGILKIKTGSYSFLQQILAYQLVKGNTASMLSQGIPWIEIFCGVLLLVGFLTPLITVISYALLWIFTVAIISILLRKKQVECGCFGRQDNSYVTQVQWTIAYRNLGLMGILLIVYAIGATPFSIDIWLGQWDYFIGSKVFLQKLLLITWSCSLVLTIGLQLLMQTRLFSGQGTPSTRGG